ncbi:M20/M25/M40 family metallo-hydrolase [Candidatus Xianfuyuplasma coldseepsis]|uniref:M20/M25/M40 family metallo-hydrolase n=1 Tax=Candidatus Xianfuyuplasma coldseepsis TaxID=2782163 RepID=A0A7L7KSC0_9MOLU|nr:M20/M25/M40 family metallo-hydrolase [Xianfuyuplasma coldseepsis]QMS85309.1 M20/M25/M40 family metallo-hydrolase [Xianfuyuplasma coldseepsis]
MIGLYILLGVVGLILVLLLVALIRSFVIKDKNLNISPIEVDKTLSEQYANEFQKMIQVKTLSYDPKTKDVTAFEAFHKVLQELFPNVYNTMEQTVFEGHSILFKWTGKSSDKPIVLMAHQDVVPASNSGWDYPPFSGHLTEDLIYGRGTLDTKSTLYGIFKAIDELIGQGFTPEHDIYISSSTDEETSGFGAHKSVEKLQEFGVKPYLVLDEGGAIVRGSLPSVQKPIALIGVLEKGYANIKFTAKSAGGHSSYPPKNSPIARLSAFVQDVENHFPLKTKMIPEVAAIFSEAAPAMKGPYRFLFGNLWLFKPLLTWLLPKINPFGRALLSTTIAFTMQEGSDAENVIPAEASVTANLRIHPIQNIDSSFNVLQKIAKKYDIEAELLEAREASPISSTSNDAYRYIVKMIMKNYPDVLVSPYVMLGGTDCRYFSEITESALRFSPVRMDNKDLKKIHGINEAIPKTCLTEAVLFYKDIIINHQ